MKFKVGDVCVIEFRKRVGAATAKYDGTECTITAISFDTTIFGVRHQCLLCDGEPAAIAEMFLRLKRPPSWDSWLYDTRLVKFEHEMQDQKKALAQLEKQGRLLKAGIDPRYL